MSPEALGVLVHASVRYRHHQHTKRLPTPWTTRPVLAEIRILGGGGGEAHTHESFVRLPSESSLSRRRSSPCAPRAALREKAWLGSTSTVSGSARREPCTRPSSASRTLSVTSTGSAGSPCTSTCTVTGECGQASWAGPEMMDRAMDPPSGVPMTEEWTASCEADRTCVSHEGELWRRVGASASSVAPAEGGPDESKAGAERGRARGIPPPSFSRARISRTICRELGAGAWSVLPSRPTSQAR